MWSEDDIFWSEEVNNVINRAICYQIDLARKSAYLGLSASRLPTDIVERIAAEIAADAEYQFKQWLWRIKSIHANTFHDLDWMVDQGFMPNYDYS